MNIPVSLRMRMAPSRAMRSFTYNAEICISSIWMSGQEGGTFHKNVRIEALFALEFRMPFFEKRTDTLAAIFRMKAFHLQLDFVIEGFHQGVLMASK